MTQSYIGAKQIIAWEQSKDGEDGYAVKYADGYVSWSPKAIFEAAYLPMGHVDHLPAHQQRVVGERIQLEDKVNKLASFFKTDLFKSLDDAEQERLTAQLGAMGEYLDLLVERIEAF